MQPWHSLFRNRRGALCVVCCCLLFFVVVVTSTWAWLCVSTRHLHPLPDGFVPGVVALGAVKGWQYREDGEHVDTPHGA